MTDLARFSKEQTAAFLRGETDRIGRPEWADPEQQRRQDAQRERLRQALKTATVALIEALGPDSIQTAERLAQIAEAAFADSSNQQARNMLTVMYSELIAQALL